MLILASYDIPDDRRRVRIAETLKDFGQRVQYSVFECDLTGEQLGRLRKRLGALLEAEEDSLRLYALCGHCRERVEVLGVGMPPEEDPDLYVV